MSFEKKKNDKEKSKILQESLAKLSKKSLALPLQLQLLSKA
jgi:hypothetical protein